MPRVRVSGLPVARQAAAAGIRRRAAAYGYSGTERVGADECARYLKARRKT